MFKYERQTDKVEICDPVTDRSRLAQIKEQLPRILFLFLVVGLLFTIIGFGIAAANLNAKLNRITNRQRELNSIQPAVASSLTSNDKQNVSRTLNSQEQEELDQILAQKLDKIKGRMKDDEEKRLNEMKTQAERRVKELSAKLTGLRMLLKDQVQKRREQMEEIGNVKDTIDGVQVSIRQQNDQYQDYLKNSSKVVQDFKAKIDTLKTDANKIKVDFLTRHNATVDEMRQNVDELNKRLDIAIRNKDESDENTTRLAEKFRDKLERIKDKLSENKRIQTQFTSNEKTKIATLQAKLYNLTTKLDNATTTQDSQVKVLNNLKDNITKMATVASRIEEDMKAKTKAAKQINDRVKVLEGKINELISANQTGTCPSPVNFTRAALTEQMMNLIEQHVDDYHSYLKYASWDPPLSMGVAKPPYVFGGLPDLLPHLDMQQVVNTYYRVYWLSGVNKAAKVSHGGWLTVMMRSEPWDVTFNRTFKEYEEGFGNTFSMDYWLGLSALYEYMKHPGNYALNLRIDKVKRKRKQSMAITALFGNVTLTKSIDGYRLTVGGYLSKHPYSNWHKVLDNFPTFEDNAPFSTFDRDNDDLDDINCAAVFGGGWFMKNCTNMFIPTTNCMKYWTNDKKVTPQNIAELSYQMKCKQGFFGKIGRRLSKPQGSQVISLKHSEMYISVYRTDKKFYDRYVKNG